MPPFRTSYYNASLINLGCFSSTICRNNILDASKFVIQDVQVMYFDGNAVIHFPVYLNRAKSLDTTFVQRIENYRRRLHDFGIEYWNPVPEGYRPHITIGIIPTRKRLVVMRRLVVRGHHEDEIHFHASYPTVYAKYKDVGYQTLSSNPNW